MTEDMKKILIVEDNPGDVYLIKEILKRYKPDSFDVISAERLDEGFAILEKEEVDLILLDMNLPDSRGMETVFAVREKAPDVAVVVLTGDEDEQLGMDAVKHGAQDFLVKGKVPGFVLVRVIGYAMERQAAEKKLRESELFLRSTLDALSSHIAIIDERGVILAVNEAWRSFARNNQADLAKVCEGSNYFAACSEIHGDDTLDARKFLTGMRSVLSGEVDSFWLEYPCHSPSEKRWFFCRITPFHKPGPPCIVVSHENITQRKLAEEALRNSELKLRTILDSLTIQIVFLGLDHRIIWANQAVCDFARCNRASLKGNNCYNFWEGQTDRCSDCAVEQSIIQGKPVMNMRKAANGKIWNIMGCPVRDQEGRIVSMIEVREDITEKVTAEEQFLQAQKMDAVGRLAGGVAHDFNNMLSIIIGFAELSRSCVASDNPLAENLNEILSAAKRSTDLTRHLLAFARKQPVVPKVLDCNLIIENSRKMLGRLVGEDIDIRFISCESLWSIHMDPTQIDQILTNLSANARDAIAGTGTITIETQNVILDETYCKTHVYAKPGLYVMILFSDSGSGMDEETRQRVFEPFFTTKPLGEGTGLGLSTVFGIVKQNNGMINLYSEPGVGTTFKVYIPRHSGVGEKEEDAFSDLCPRGTETIMVVEDEKKILKLCKHLLSDLGYRVMCFSSPEKAVRYLGRSRWTINLLISDVVMPGMNGDALRQQVEKIRPDIKTLFMSGYTYNVISQRGVMPQSLQFIQKPFTLLELATKVRDVLDM
jgi:signal transduction histidine kinase/DNA-binding response OmpR family regulator